MNLQVRSMIENNAGPPAKGIVPKTRMTASEAGKGNRVAALALIIAATGQVALFSLVFEMANRTVQTNRPVLGIAPQA